MRDSQVERPDDIAGLNHRKQRRVESVVKAETFSSKPNRKCAGEEATIRTNMKVLDTQIKLKIALQNELS